MSYPALAGPIFCCCYFAFASRFFIDDGTSLRSAWPFVVFTAVMSALVNVSAFVGARQQTNDVTRIIASSVDATSWSVQ
jgi:hypothetical protein